MMLKYQNKILTTLGIVFISSLLIFPLNYANAGACGDLIVLKNGKQVKESGSLKIPAKDQSKWELKITTSRTRSTCQDDFAKVTLVYIDKENRKGSPETIVAEQKIGKGSEINKTISLKTDSGEGTYKYSMQSRKDQTTATYTSNDLMIILGDPGKGGAGTVGTGGGGSVDTKTNANFNMSFDQEIGSFWNPLEGYVGTVPQLITSLIRILFALIGIAAVIVIIVSGFKMVMASGDEAELKKAKQAITWAIIGLIVSLLAFSIVAIIQRLIQIGAN